MDFTLSNPKEDGLKAEQQSLDRLPDKGPDTMKDKLLKPAVTTEANVNEMTGSSNAESIRLAPLQEHKQPVQPILERGEQLGEPQHAAVDQQSGLAAPSAESISGDHVSFPDQSQTYAVREEADQTAHSTFQGNNGPSIIRAEQSRSPSTEGETEAISMYPSLGYNTGLDVDSNPTETDRSDADSAIGQSVHSSTFSASSSVYDFVEENGRTYHKFKEGKYYLPNDEVSNPP